MKRLFEISNLLLGSRNIRRRTNKTGQRRKPVFPQYAEILETRCLLSVTLLADASADDFSHAHDEPSTIAAGDSQIIIGPHHFDPGHSSTQTHFFAETGDDHHFAWQDQDLSTPDVIDINYDFRDLGGRWGANLITVGQIAMAELALDKWEIASGGKILFTQNTMASKDDIIIIGTGNLRALGFRSGPGGILGLGGGTYTHNDAHTITGGVAWQDSKDEWDEENGNGDVDGTFDYFTVVAQEIGHALGLGHTDGMGGTNIMNGSYTGEVADYSANDAEHIQSAYGASGPIDEAPTVDITSPTGTTFASGDTIAIDFAGTASDTENGDLTAGLIWTSNLDGQIGTGGIFSTTLSVGNHTITASVTDSASNTTSESISITVGTPTVATTVSVDSISYATEGGKNGNNNLLITPALLDDLGDPTSGASVTIRLTHVDSGDSWTGTATTGTNGTVTFKLRRAPAGTYTTVINNVTADSLTWDGSTPANGFTKPSAATAAVTLEIDTPQTENSSDAIPVLFVTDMTESAETDSVNDDVASDDVVLSVVAVADWNPEETDETSEDNTTEETEPVAVSSQDLDELFTGLPSDELLADVI